MPNRDRVGPPLLVPLMEAAAFLALVVIAAKPGPVPRAARPFVLFVFSLLILVLTAASDDDDGVTLGEDVESRHVRAG